MKSSLIGWVGASIFVKRSLPNLKYLLFLFCLSATSYASIHVGVGKAEITPPISTPSAGYIERQGVGMRGVADPLLATALLIDNGEKRMIFCSVDHLGFTYEMTQEIKRRLHLREPNTHLYIASSHTHSGGGAYLDIPVIGEALAGPYQKEIKEFYIEKTTEAILKACRNLTPAKVGIGYGKTALLSQCRHNPSLTPSCDMTVIKVTTLEDAPLAVFFHYPLHPTVFDHRNEHFSSDFVGCARASICSLLGTHITTLYCNGAQGEIIPLLVDEKAPSKTCHAIGNSLAETVKEIWDTTLATDTLQIKTEDLYYTFQPKKTSSGIQLPIDEYASSMHAIIFNTSHAFITIPGELSTLYDKEIKAIGQTLGYQNVSLLGLINDAHGYIITPESWREKTSESRLAFGGEFYGEQTKQRALELLKRSTPLSK